MSAATSQNPYHMTDLQMAIMKGIVNGKNNRQIANELIYSEGTVKAASMVIYQLMQVENRVQAAVKWVREQENGT
jgi:DNA-binding NarL/FixJ family response regulator